MTSELEFRAKTIEKALDDASRALDVSRDELDYEVLSGGSSGLLGLMGLKKAKIRVRVKGEAASEESGKNKAPDQAQLNGQPLPTKESENKDGRDDALRLETVSLDALRRILAPLDPGVVIDTRWARGTLELDVRGEDSGLIIGKHGQTLEAIQYLVEKIVNRAMGKHTRVRIDVEGYLANRKENLKRLALKQAEKAWRTGRPASVGQMNAYERRIVHMALKEDRRVRTQSIGSGMIRKLIIIPKKQRRNGPRRPKEE